MGFLQKKSHALGLKKMIQVRLNLVLFGLIAGLMLNLKSIGKTLFFLFSIMYLLMKFLKASLLVFAVLYVEFEQISWHRFLLPPLLYNSIIGSFIECLEFLKPNNILWNKQFQISTWTLICIMPISIFSVSFYTIVLQNIFNNS